MISLLLFLKIKSIFVLEKNCNFTKNPSKKIRLKIFKKFKIMKQIILLIAIIAMSLTVKAQIGREDVLVSKMDLSYNRETKISVADNGYIYILIHSYKNAFIESKWELFCSKDEGVTYQQIQSYSQNSSQIKSCDIVATGATQAETKVWVAMSLFDPSTEIATIKINCYNANGQLTNNAYSKEYLDTRIYDIAISSDYRSPSSGGDPFFLGLIYTGFNYFVEYSFIDYIYSDNGGNTFKYKPIYEILEEDHLGRIDFSYGSRSVTGSSGFGHLGIVLEMNKTAENEANIGFLANFSDYDGMFKWENPVMLSSNKKSGFPSIQWMQNNQAEVTNENIGKYSFMIAFHEQNSSTNNYDIQFYFPKNTFKIAPQHTPVLTDFGNYNFNGINNEKYPDLSYDKSKNNFLLTYIDEDNAKFTQINFNEIDDINNWVNVGEGVYSSAKINSSNPDDFSYYSNPVVDINPVKKESCFAWTHNYKNTVQAESFCSIYADVQWSPVNTEDVKVNEDLIKITPNPTSNKAIIAMPESGNYTATLYDLHGKTLNKFKFNSDTYEIDIDKLPSGVYILTVNSEKKIYSSKIIKK